MRRPSMYWKRLGLNQRLLCSLPNSESDCEVIRFRISILRAKPRVWRGFYKIVTKLTSRRVVPFRDTSLATFSIIRTKKTGHDPEFVALKYRHGAKTFLAKFEECLQRLEKIVEELEKGEIQLEKSLTLFEEGIQLSSACRKELEQAEGKVELLLKKNGKLQAEPFEPVAEKAPLAGRLPQLGIQ